MTARRKFERRQRKREGRAGVREGQPSRVTEIELGELDANPDRLRQVLQRVDRRELEPEDWAVLRAVLRDAM